jgi:hypothetical protein
LQGAPSAQWFATLTWTQVAAAGGFALVLLGSFFSWFSASGGGASATGGAFDDNAQYRIGDWLGTSDLPIDGLLVLAAGVAGLAVMAAMLTGRLPGAQAWMYVGALGGASVALGVLEIQFIASRPTGPGFSINPGFGLYFVVIGGALAALSRFIPAKPVQSQR